MGISVITLIEIVCLSENQRLEAETLPRMLQTLQNPDDVLVEMPMDSEVIAHLQQIPRDQVPNLPDRVIAAEALQYGVTLITRDRKFKRRIWIGLW